MRFVHSGIGKNATDMLICIEALDLLARGAVRGIILATSDGDFTHLALHLRERGTACICIGTQQMTPHLRWAAKEHRILVPPVSRPAPDPAAATLSGIIRAEGGKIALQKINVHMQRQSPAFRIADHGGTWRKWLAARTHVFAVSGAAQETYVSLVP